VSAVAIAVRRPDREPPTAALVGYAVAAVIGIGWIFLAFDSWPDAFMVLPFAAVGIGALVKAVVDRAPGRVALVGTLALSAACTATAVGYSVGRYNDRLVDQRRATATLMQVLPDARIFSVRAPQALVLTRQRQGSRYQLFGMGMFDYIDDTYPGGIRGYGRWVERHAPTVVALAKDLPPWLAPMIRRDYVEVRRAPGWRWFIRRDVGAETIRDLDEALTARARQDEQHDRTAR
jgi:hypothetical protein